MARTAKQSHEQVLGLGIALEKVLVDDVLPAMSFHFTLEEDQEVGIVLLVSEILLGMGPVPELLGHSVVRFQGVPLVVGIAIPCLLQRTGASSCSEQREQVMGDLFLRSEP